MKVRFDGKEQRDPTRVDGISVPYAPGKRIAARWRWYLVLFLAASPLLFFVARNIFQAAVIEAPAEVFLNVFNVTAPVPGSIAYLEVSAGDQVEKGQKLVVIKERRTQERLAIAEKDLALLGADNPSALESALELALSVERRLAAYVKKLRGLMALGAATQAEVAAAEERLDTARKDVILARNALHRAFVQGEGSKDYLGLLSSLDSGTAISAPVSGEVLEAAVRQGEHVSQGAQMVAIAQKDFARIVAYVKSGDLWRIVKDDEVNAHFYGGDSLPCRVVLLESTTRRSTLASSDSPEERRVPVVLEPVNPLPASYARQGLPCKVFFGVRRIF